MTPQTEILTQNNTILSYEIQQSMVRQHGK